MFMNHFTVEETNLIAIYKEETAAATLARIAAALPDMDADMRAIAESASRKLAGLTEPEFAALSFTPADEADEGERV
jgi:hypothetical protein